MFYIVYKIKGYIGTQHAGPYSQNEIKSHKEDIASFEGVYDVEVKRATPAQNQNYKK